MNNGILANNQNVTTNKGGVNTMNNMNEDDYFLGDATYFVENLNDYLTKNNYSFKGSSIPYIGGSYEEYKEARDRISMYITCESKHKNDLTNINMNEELCNIAISKSSFVYVLNHYKGEKNIDAMMEEWFKYFIKIYDDNNMAVYIIDKLLYHIMQEVIISINILAGKDNEYVIMLLNMIEKYYTKNIIEKLGINIQGQQNIQTKPNAVNISSNIDMQKYVSMINDSIKEAKATQLPNNTVKDVTPQQSNKVIVEPEVAITAGSIARNLRDANNNNVSQTQMDRFLNQDSFQKIGNIISYNISNWSNNQVPTQYTIQNNLIYIYGTNRTTGQTNIITVDPVGVLLDTRPKWFNGLVDPNINTNLNLCYMSSFKSYRLLDNNNNLIGLEYMYVYLTGGLSIPLNYSEDSLRLYDDKSMLSFNFINYKSILYNSNLSIGAKRQMIEGLVRAMQNKDMMNEVCKTQKFPIFSLDESETYSNASFVVKSDFDYSSNLASIIRLRFTLKQDGIYDINIL